MQSKLSVTVALTAIAASIVGRGGDANAQFPELIPTKMALARFGGSPAAGRMYKFLSKAPRGGPLFQLPSASPATTGGSLTATIGSGAVDCSLTPGLFNGTVGWKELGSPAGSRGYKYLNKNAPTTDPCKVVIIKEKVIKVIALGTGTVAAPVDYPPGNPDISTVLTLGGEDYCAYATAPHSGESADRYIKAKDQPAPGSCPGVPTTTSTAVTSTTSTTTTPTTTTTTTTSTTPTTSTTTSTTGISTTTTSSTTTTTITLECNCCSTGLDLLSFETTVASGSAGALRNFRCSNYTGAACASGSDCDFGTCFVMPPICSGNFSVPCTSDADCTGVCEEQYSGGHPRDLEAGRLYAGAGLNSVPFPLVPDKGKSFTRIVACNPGSGELTLGATTPGEVGNRHCTSGRKCSTSGSSCLRDIDCPGQETCDTQCFFGAPMPATNVSTPVWSFCVINHVAEDASGTASCGGSVSDLSLPLRAVFHRTGDLFTSSEPPDVPGVQPCPICDTLCQGGPKHRFPCADDGDCPEGSCGTSPQCLGGPNDSNPCMSETSGTAELGDGFPTSHDCPPDPLTDVTVFSVGLPLMLSLTTGSIAVNAVDQPNAARVFFGFCRDMLGQESNCFEGEPDFGRCWWRSNGLCYDDSSPCSVDSDCPGSFCFYWVLPTSIACWDESDCPEDGYVYYCAPGYNCPPSTPPAPGGPARCTSDADCADGDEYESCVQPNPGALSDAAATRIEVSGDTDGQCLADGEPHASELVSVFPIPPLFDPDGDAMFDLPGSGAVLLQGEIRLE